MAPVTASRSADVHPRPRRRECGTGTPGCTPGCAWCELEPQYSCLLQPQFHAALDDNAAQNAEYLVQSNNT